MLSFTALFLVFLLKYNNIIIFIMELNMMLNSDVEKSDNLHISTETHT